jgi:hypothetical protein
MASSQKAYLIDDNLCGPNMGMIMAACRMSAGSGTPSVNRACKGNRTGWRSR